MLTTMSGERLSRAAVRTLPRYPSERMDSLMRSSVSLPTSSGWLSARETVAGETPVSSAICAMVIFLFAAIGLLSNLRARR